MPGGGSLAAGTYFYKVVARVAGGPDQQGELVRVGRSVGDDRRRARPAACTISWTPVVGADEYLVYGRAAGAENMYWKTTTPYFTDTGAAGTRRHAGDRRRNGR